MNLFELYLTPLDAKQFRVMVTQSSIASDAEADTTLPFWAVAEDWRTTIVKTLEATGWRSGVDVFPRPGEQDWMIAANILSGKRDNFAPDYLARIGQALYDSLLPMGRIREAFQVALRGAEAANEALHLRLKFPAEAAKRSRLADYPWELLHDGQRFLLNRDVYLSRYIAYEGVPPSLPVQAKIQVLLVSPRPADVAQLPDTEQQALRDGIAKAELVGLVALKQLSKPTLKDLSRHLTECNPVPQVIHFDGHGIFGKKCGNDRCQYVNPGMAAKTCKQCSQTLPEAQGFLVFEDEAGQADYVSATSFAALLPKGIVLVVLSACQSGMAISGDSVFNGTAQQLIDARVPAVVAMQYKVSVAAASGFVEQFYRVLGQRRSVLEATNAGRKWMGVDGNQWYRPVVYLRWRDNDGGQLFAEQWINAVPSLPIDSVMGTGEGQKMKDFFVSYNRADKQWAEWIAWTLEEAGYSVVIQAWDFRPGGNFVLDMQRSAAESQKTIAVLSESYLKSSFTQPEWAAAFASDPESLERMLLPVRVKECKPEGLLRPIIYVDLVGRSPDDAKQALLNSLALRAKPSQPPAFPGMEVSVPDTMPVTERVIETPKAFPSALGRVQKVKEEALLQQLDNLIADHGAANQQLGGTNDAVARTRLERLLTAIAQDMDKVAADLDALGA
jgi:TIR domain/CHAT domain/Effector-associated domain 9